MRQKGQTILILLLVMSVALAIGLSIVQKSLVDVSTSSKVDQSSRAFSAAEAGLEKALASSAPVATSLPNNSQITEIKDSGAIPCIPGSSGCVQGVGTVQAALEAAPPAAPLSKDEVAQVWLSDPTSNLSTNPPSCTGGTYNVCYTQTTLDVYWGNSQTDKAALFLTLAYWDGTAFQSRKWYLDNDPTGTRNNGFDKSPTCSGNYSLTGYQCKKTLGDNTTTSTASPNGPLPSSPSFLMLLRARLLYNINSQPFAVQATGNCGANCSLPPQARIITSTGASGETQRRVQLFQSTKVIPPFFDYAIFSAGDISK